MEALAADAYAYLYPLVLMDITRLKQCRTMNQFRPSREYPPGTFRGVVRPNFDTLYSIAWLDLRDGPLVITVPDTAGRYYCMHMMDMWTESFAVPGSRTWGTGATACVVCGPNDSEADVIPNAPEGAAVVSSSTSFVWIINRIQTNGVEDYETVHALQDGFGLERLEMANSSPPPLMVEQAERVSDSKKPPMLLARDLTPKEFFEYAAKLMAIHPQHQADGSMLLRLRSLGLKQGQYGTFSFDNLPAELQSALNVGCTDGYNAIRGSGGISAGEAFNGAIFHWVFS